MEPDIVDATLQDVRQALDERDITRAVRLLHKLLPPDQADVFEELDIEQQQELLPRLRLPEAADIMEELEDEDAALLARQLSPAALARILDQMEPDEAADLLGDLDSALSAAALARMEEADEVRPLLVHPDESAGGRMTTEFLAFREHMTVRQALLAMRRAEGRILEVPRLFVVDLERHLVGAVDLYILLRADPNTTLGELVEREIVTVHAEDDQEVAARLMLRYDLPAVPVVDESNRLVGVITADDLAQVLEEEATEDIQRFGGAEPLGHSYLGSSIAAAIRARAGWLVVLLLATALAGTVMGLYEELLGEVIVLTFFVPMIMATGGNAGSQTIANVVRAQAVGDVGMGDTLRVLWREVRSGLILGLLLGVCAFAVALAWGTPLLALTVALSIGAVSVWGNVLGAALPLITMRINQDPALVSGPLLMTIIDVTGLFIYFSIARLVLGI
jgi:magnesium transporter